MSTSHELRRDVIRHGGPIALLRAETHRFGARRFIQLLLALDLIAYLVIVGLVGTLHFGRVTDADRAQAQRQLDQIVTEQKQYYDECLKSPRPPGVPADAPPEVWCGMPPTPEGMPVEQFLPHTPFVFADGVPVGLILVTSAVAALFFLIGATWIGAEWSARTLMAQLFWETRRLRVLGAKLAVLTGAAVAATGVVALIWLGTARLLAATRGSMGTLPAHFWSDVAAQTGRSALLVVWAALLGFAVAHLTRGTGAALGVAFLYFAILEPAVSAFLPRVTPWTLGTNITALIAPGGTKVFLPDPGVGAQGQFEQTRELVIGNLRGGLVLAAVVLAILALGGWLFRRRDLT